MMTEQRGQQPKKIVLPPYQNFQDISYNEHFFSQQPVDETVWEFAFCVFIG